MDDKNVEIDVIDNASLESETSILDAVNDGMPNISQTELNDKSMGEAINASVLKNNQVASEASKREDESKIDELEVHSQFVVERRLVVGALFPNLLV